MRARKPGPDAGGRRRIADIRIGVGFGVRHRIDFFDTVHSNVFQFARRNGGLTRQDAELHSGRLAGLLYRRLMGDIGILASLDPVALDRASLDQVYLSDDPGKDALIARIESHDGAHLLDYAESLGLGSQAYELVPA